MDRTLLVLFALLLNAVAGGPRRFYARLGISGLAALPAQGLRLLERKLNRERRSPKDRELRGWFVLAAAAFVTLIAGVVGSWLFQADLRFIELLLAALLLPVRPVRDRAAEIRDALAAGDIEAARRSLSGTVWKHHARLDAHAVARAGIEITAVEFSEKIVAPALAYLLVGLPGLLLVACVGLARDTWSNAGEFGHGARQVHDILHYLPSRLAAALWLLAPVFFPTVRTRDAAIFVGNRLVDDAPRRLNLRVAAAVAKTSLGGPASPYAQQWFEAGPLKTLPADLRRAMAAYIFANVFLFVLIGILF